MRRKPSAQRISPLTVQELPSPSIVWVFLRSWFSSLAASSFSSESVDAGGGRMKESTPDLFDPQAIMNSDFFPGKGTFAFAFDNDVFSDRVLRIEIVASPTDDKAARDGCSSVAEWARNRKRRREDIKKDNAITELAIYPEEHVLNCNQPDSDDGVFYDNQDEEAMAMVDESPVGVGMVASPADNAAELNNNATCNLNSPAILRVKSIHISSPILAAKSPFFYKLFSNGMRESEQRHVTLRVSESEEVAAIELLNFMYSETLSATTAPGLLDVLMAADKFEVASCMRYCCRLLRSLPMTPESALLYLDLPSSVRMADAVQPLTDAAKQFLATHYKDLSKHQDEVLNLPLVGIEVVLGSDDLQVPSEDAVYDFVLKWARAQYTKPEERREILDTRLIRLVRFPYMTCRKLKKVLTCNEFDKELAGKAVLDALFFKAEMPHRQRSLLSDDSGNRRLVERERAYKYRPVKVVEFDQPYQQCIVYLNLKREECANLFPCGRLYSQAFHLGGQGFFLSAHCNMDQLSSFHCFGLFLGMQEKGSVSFAVDYEFAARTNPTGDFLSKYKGNYTFTGGKAVGYRNLFAIPWMSFIAEDSHFFINGTLHLRAELTIRKQPC